MFSDVISQSHMFLGKFHDFLQSTHINLKNLKSLMATYERMGMRGPHTNVIGLENRLKPNKYALN